MKSEKRREESDEGKGELIIPKDAPKYLRIDCERVEILERGVKIVAMEVENFIANFDRIVFVGKDGKKTVFEKVKKRPKGGYQPIRGKGFGKGGDK